MYLGLITMPEEQVRLLKRRRITDFPEVHIHLDPDVLARIERTAERRSLSVSAVIRETLGLAYSTTFFLGSSKLGDGKLGW